ncbi:MAG TPA: hypothetical protein VLL48_06595 [Longimicrobiales bacterium]|nr:hypothetical protein [Longimicrobiales bacterium]
MSWEESRTFYERGRAAMADGDLEMAVTLLRRSHLVAPHFKTLELIGECLLGLERPVEAIEPLAAATALNPQVRAPSLLAEAFLAAGDQEGALQFARRVLSIDPQNRRALRVIGVLGGGSGRGREGGPGSGEEGSEGE